MSEESQVTGSCENIPENTRNSIISEQRFSKQFDPKLGTPQKRNGRNNVLRQITARFFDSEKQKQIANLSNVWCNFESFESLKNVVESCWRHSPDRIKFGDASVDKIIACLVNSNLELTEELDFNHVTNSLTGIPITQPVVFVSLRLPDQPVKAKPLEIKRNPSPMQNRRGVSPLPKRMPSPSIAKRPVLTETPGKLMSRGGPCASPMRAKSNARASRVIENTPSKKEAPKAPANELAPGAVAVAVALPEAVVQAVVEVPATPSPKEAAPVVDAVVNTPKFLSPEKLRRKSMAVEESLSSVWKDSGSSPVPGQAPELSSFKYVSEDEEDSEEEEAEDVGKVQQADEDAAVASAETVSSIPNADSADSDSAAAEENEASEASISDVSVTLQPQAPGSKSTPGKIRRKAFLPSFGLGKSKKGKQVAEHTVIDVKEKIADVKTAGEAITDFNQHMRSYKLSENQQQAEERKKMGNVVKANNASSLMSTPHKSKRSGAAATAELSISPVFPGMSKSGKGSKDAEGRPSIGTITTQWEFLRANFLNNNEEELEWLMVSKRPGAFKYANQKNIRSEDKYFKALHDIEHCEKKLTYLAGPTAQIPSLVAELAGQYSDINLLPKGKDISSPVFDKVQATLTALKKYTASSDMTHVLSAFSQNAGVLINQILNEDEGEKHKIVRKARELQALLPSEIQAMQQKLRTARSDSEQALKNMEQWAKRETETDDYAQVMRQKEVEWLNAEASANAQALSTMRSFIPVGVVEMTVGDIMEAAKRDGGLLSLELATEIKNNKLLHWVITHPDDIATMSFLSGDKKSFFENIEGLDIIELRAIAVCLPVKFELDNDGKKAEWRNRFMTRVKQLVSQQNREKVKGIWNDALNARQMIELPPLKPEQARRSVYYFRTREQSDLKLKQYDDKAALLAKKEGWLKKAEEDAAEAKKEYDTILKEMRDPDFLEMYGTEQLAAAKELAKKEFTDTESKRKTLHGDVARLRKAIADMPITRDQFAAMDADIENFLCVQKDGFDWREKGQAPVMIEGVFDPCPEIKKAERQAARFMSAEEEAAKRKLELSSLTSKKADNAQDDSAPDGPLSATSSSSSDAAFLCEGSFKNGLAAAAEAVPVAPVGFATPRKRNSVLTSANPDVLSTLNKMFSPQAPPSALRSAIKRPTVAALVPAEVPMIPGAAPETTKKPAKKTQSKLLRKLLFGKDSSPSKSPKRGNLSPKRSAGPMSFLDQIKGFKKKPVAESGLDGADAEPEKPPMSFLDQIKKMGTKAPAAGKEEDAPPSKPAKPAMGLFDAIRARRKE